VSTQTPETDAAARGCREWAERLVLSFITPSGGFVHPSQMVEAFAAALRAAEKDAARAMRDRAAQTLEGMLPGSGQVFRPDRAWGEKAVAAVRSLEV
jgi:hypothetical protein